MARSRHFVPPTKPDLDIRRTPRSRDTLALFDRYRILPWNWMHALVDPQSNPDAYRNLLTRMTRDAKLLERKTQNGRGNNCQTQSYSRTPAGDQFLHGANFEPLPHDSHHDIHQELVDMAEAQIELGAKGSPVDYHSWKDIKENDATPQLPDFPFRFQVGTNGSKGIYQIPDGRPFALNGSQGAMLFIRELDRNTEAPETIRIKLRNYKAMYPEIKKRYGFDHFRLLFITTNKTREDNILKWIKEEWPQGCYWILTQTMQDHVSECLSTAPVTTHLFEQPYRRAGYSNYSLTTLSEVP